MGPKEVSGLIAPGGGNWGQKVTVRLEPRQLRVTSSFSIPQSFGASTNQRNIDRFKTEWDRRESSEAS
jgi:hypothetical protein